ncbi:MAG: hypothetical protein IV100_27005 [Myxococcales bacterium]|nr:hypothetical protein [Myxococcales bacterium]
MDQAFPNGEVTYMGVNWNESRASVEAYLRDTGLRVPIMMDNPAFWAEEAPGCAVIPEGQVTLSNLFWNKIGSPTLDPPFPTHVIIDHHGKFAYLARNHNPDRVVKVLKDLVAQQEAEQAAQKQ